jgi:hypothetical protein
MSKRTIGIFFIVSIIMGLVGAGLIIGGLAGSTYTSTTSGYSTNVQLTSIGNAPLFVFGIIIASLSAIPYLIAWIGALINLARLQQWVWFILMLLFSGITLIVYLFAGPTTRPGVPQYAQNMPPQYYPQQPPNYPQQPPPNYPQQQPPPNYPQPSQEYPQQQPPPNYPQPPQDYPRQ